MNDKLLVVENLKKYFPVDKTLFSKAKSFVHAVDGVSFQIAPGETLGLVGESGCGKTTAGKSILRLIEPDTGDVTFQGQDITKLPKKEMKNLRRQMQIIFQDPFSSLNPRLAVASIVGTPIEIHNLAQNKGKKEIIADLLVKVGLKADDMRRYPHQFSGGQRQRIGIARALACKPKLIVGDEPVSALDVSVQAHIINLMQSLQKEFGLTYLFISHDLSVVRHMSDDIAVMYLGKIVEMAKADLIYDNFKHPYTEALLSAAPVPNPRASKKRIILHGDVSNPIDPPAGCRFHPRCNQCKDICEHQEPELKKVEDHHYVACHL